MAIGPRGVTTRELGAVAVGAGIVVIPFVAMFIAGVQYSLLWTAVIALGAIALVPFVYELHYKSGSSDPFEPIFWIAPAMFLWFGAQTALRLVNDNFEMYGNYVSSTSPATTMFLVLLLATLGLCCIYIGYYSSVGGRIGERVPSFNAGWSSRRAWVAIVVLLLIGIAGYLSLRSAIGDGPRSQLAGGSTTTGFIAVNLLRTAAVVAIADTLIALRRGESAPLFENPRSWFEARLQPYRWIIPRLLVTAVVLLVGVRLLWTLGGRGRAFGVLVMAVFLFHYLFYRIPFAEGMGFFAIVKIVPEWAVGIAIALLTLDLGEVGGEITDFQLFLASRFSRLNNVTILIAGVPDVVDFQWGATFASAFFQLAPIHPFPETQYVYNDAFLPRFGHSAGVPITMLGELYLNFWIVGIIVGMVLIGIVIRAVYGCLIASSGAVAGAVLFSTLANGFLLGGNFSNAAPALGLKVLPILFVLIFVSGVSLQGGQSTLNAWRRKTTVSSEKWRKLSRTAARPRVLFLIAFVLRLIAIPLSFSRKNPYSQADAVRFGETASIIARHFVNGSFSITTQYSRTFEMWGAVLSPFWLLPGSTILAHIFVALLGSACVLNIAVITTRLHSPQAALFAGIPLAIYPSIVLVQSTLLREAAVLFCLTIAARLLLTFADRPGGWWRVGIATVAIVAAILFRPENVLIYAITIIVAIISYYWHIWWAKVTGALTVVVGAVTVYRYSDRIFSYVNRLRPKRAGGRAVYFGGVRLHDFLEGAIFAVIGGAYFLFAPFPWMVHLIRDIPVAVEGLVNIVYLFAAILGFMIVVKRNRAAAVGLAVFVGIGVSIYALITANYGTAVRHRQMFLWPIFSLGGIGLSSFWPFVNSDTASPRMIWENLTK